MRAGWSPVLAWCLYDWAYSAFTTVVTTFVFATYFVRAVAPDPATGTAAWAGMQTAAGLSIAALAAPAGAIADRGGRRRAMLALFTALMAVATAALWTVRPAPSDAARALLLVGCATVAFELATVFYNAMLPEIARPERIGRVSGLAWGAGYVGGLICLLGCLVGLIDAHPPPFGLDPARAEPVRATALVAAAWIALFGWPVVVFVPDRTARLGWGAAVRAGWAGLLATLRAAAADRTLRRFLLARMIYTDGLNTLFAFGGIYAAGQFAMGARDVLLLGVSLTLSAGVGALVFAFVEDRIGARLTVLVSLAALVVLGVGVLLATDRTTFWALALGLGLFIGPAQAASRSLMATLAPPDRRGAYFGLYALSGRVTGFLGPAALGLATAAAHSQRAGMAVILLFLAGGGALLAATRLRG
jgi:UMF1 family MFS transporter